MSTYAAIRNALTLVKPRVRLVVYATSIGRMSSGIFDLVGVASLGMFTSRAMSQSSSMPLVARSEIPFSQYVSQFEDPTFLLILGIASFLVKSLISYFLSVILARTLYFESYAITESLVQNIVFSDLERVSKRSTQEQHFIVTSGVKSSIYGVLNNFVSILGDTFLIVLFVFMLLFASPTATLLVAFILGVVGILVYRVVATRMYLAGQIIGSRSIHSTMYFQESVFGFRELKVSGRLKSFLTRFLDVEKDLSSAQVSQGIAALLPRYIMEGAVMLCLGVVAAIAFGTQDSASALITVTVFAAATARILPAIVPIQSSLGDLRANTGLAEGFYEFLKENPSIDSGKTKTASNKVIKVNQNQNENQRVVLRNVSYRYPGAQSNAVDKLDLDLVGPSWIAIVGPSGSGKSTLFDLIMGLRQPTVGFSEINGFAAPEFLEAVNEYCLYVPQRLTLVNSSLAENVAFGIKPDEIDVEKVSNALQRVGLIELIDRNPLGVWQTIGEFGTQYSGGQGQRLGLARALYSNPRILLLDESTSSLDAETEKKISEIIRDLSNEILIVSISHRIETLKNVDSIVLLEGGRITFQGPYLEFLSLNKEIE